MYWIAPDKGVKAHYEIFGKNQSALAKRIRGKGARKATTKKIKQIKLYNIKKIDSKIVRIAGSRLRTVMLTWYGE